MHELCYKKRLIGAYDYKCFISLTPEKYNKEIGQHFELTLFGQKIGNKINYISKNTAEFIMQKS